MMTALQRLKTSLKLSAGKTEELCDLPARYHRAFAAQRIQIRSLGSKLKRSSISRKSGGKRFV